jgi:predicted aldo/keto reductase-like oxidoreductase
MTQNGSGIFRRDFLKASLAMLGGGHWAATRVAASNAGPASVRRYKTLGRTGMKISDISFGSSRSADPDLVRHALDRGVNYFDTAEGYKGGSSEEAIGEGLEGKRDRVFLTSKVKAEADDSRDDIMRALEGSLRRLRTDYVDVYLNHAVNDVERLKNDEWSEFVLRAKEQGKIRFTGMSGHGGKLIECLDYGLDRDLFDVILVAYNFGQDPSFYSKMLDTFDLIALQPELPRVLAKAKSKGVGIVAMKTLMGAKLNDMRPHETGGRTFSQAAFRWVLSNADVDALVISMKSREGIDEYLGASGASGVDSGDVELLRRYVSESSGTYCRHACNACAGSCPHGVEIPEVLRTRMYAVDYGDLELARDDYAALGPGASACSTCTHQSCLGACSFGLPIAALTREARDLLEA